MICVLVFGLINGSLLQVIMPYSGLLNDLQFFESDYLSFLIGEF